MTDDSDLIIPSDFPWPAPQAVSSSTFTPPPIDGTLKLHEMVEYNRLHSSAHPAWEYPSLTDPSITEVLSWSDYGAAMHAAAHLIEAAVPSNGTRKVIAVISTVNQPTFLALELGMLRTGHIPFLISPRNSLTAIIHLLKVTKSTHLIVDADNASFLKLSTDAVETVERDSGLRIPILPTPQFTDLYGVEFRPYVPQIKTSLRDVAIILHSSGSTAFPKPINTSQAMLLEFSRLFWFSDTDMCGKRENGMVLPSFHNYAVVQLLSKQIPSGKINCTYNPHIPTRIPTPAQALTDIVASNCYTLLMVPAFLSEWSRDPAAIGQLAKFQAVFTGGAPTSKEVGQALLEGGVRLTNLYGSTECGISSRLLISNTLGPDWECIEKVGAMNWHLTDEKDGTFELHVMQHRFCNPGVLNFSLPDGSRGFSTSDLLAPHPMNPKLWRIVGRKDEQILLANGEKTNPLPSEGIVNKDDFILDSMMFGEGQNQNGILVVPRPPMKVDVSDEKAVATFRNLIWTSVEKANDIAPQHSRIFKEMILVATPSKPFDYTPKMSLRRKVVLQSYKSEIDALYAAKNASTLQIARPESWSDSSSILGFVQRVVGEVLRGVKVADRDDLFNHGCDSLQATYIRNTIIKSLEDSDIVTSGIPMNFVYLHPSVSELASYLSKVVANEADAETVDQAISQMKSLIDKYSTNFPSHTPTSTSLSPPPRVVLLTGSTGALGSYLLTQLLQDPTVTKIYAFNRSSSIPLSTRQHTSFLSRDLPITLLSSPTLVLVDGLDVSSPTLGLSNEMYEEIRANVTEIIHNAWRLDFNLSLAQFEPQIAGVRYLIDLAFKSTLKEPPKVVFTSSVGAVSNWKGEEKVPEKHLEDLEFAVGNGYGSSKAVAEQILSKASLETGLKTLTVRIGQLCGSTINGAWNDSDWVPILLASAKYVGCLPSLDQEICWTPIDSAAQILLDFISSPSSSSSSPNQVLHITPPRPIPWNTVLSIFASSSSVPLVPYAEWLSRVGSSTEENPAQKLLGFFRKGIPVKGEEGREAMGIAKFGTERSEERSRTLRELKEVGEEDLERWLGYWKK